MPSTRPPLAPMISMAAKPGSSIRCATARQHLLTTGSGVTLAYRSYVLTFAYLYVPRSVRRCLFSADRMGLLDKHNPRATRRSAAAWAVGGGVLGGLVGLFGWSRSDMPTAAVFFIVPWMVTFCGLAGWAMEWQMPPEE